MLTQNYVVDYLNMINIAITVGALKYEAIVLRSILSSGKLIGVHYVDR